MKHFNIQKHKKAREKREVNCVLLWRSSEQVGFYRYYRGHHCFIKNLNISYQKHVECVVSMNVI